MANYTNFSVKSKDDLKRFVMTQLGHPLITVELAEEQVDSCIDMALETFTQYYLPEKKYLALNLSGYNETSGFFLPEGIISVFEIEDSSSVMGNVGDLFSAKNVLWNAGQYPVLLGSISAGLANSNFVTLELALDMTKLIRRMLGQGFQFTYDYTNRQLLINPNPVQNHINGWLAVGCNWLPPDDRLFGERWVKQFSLALCKVLLGTNRSKFDNTQLLGGGQINKRMIDDGIKERDELMTELKAFYRTPVFFVG